MQVQRIWYLWENVLNDVVCNGGIKMRRKILSGLLLVVILCISIGLGWYYIYLPHKEMSELEQFQNRLLNIEIEKVFPFPPITTEEVRLIEKIEFSISELKREVITNSVGLRTEKAKKASATLLLTAECMERMCKDTLFVERETLRVGDNGITTKEFDKKLDDYYKASNRFEDELLPLLEGHFKK